MTYVSGFDEIDRTRVADVGGKGAGLGELSRIEGLRVPAGFCVTTSAFRSVVSGQIEVRLERLARLTVDDRDAIREISAGVREVVERTWIPDYIAAEISRAVEALGPGAVAVRSSATAEDLPTASFAGQQDSYLDVAGTAAILEAVRKCWASLFSERAVTYRIRNGFDHAKVHMAVVVQRMVHPQSAGIAFTADPITGNRKVVSIEATFGLGEALVSGTVTGDVFAVRDDAIVSKTIATDKPTLTDAQAVELAQIARRIEAHFASPQDIEWCLADGDFHFVQSRPITTLFPIPSAGDAKNRVFISVGHQQMMTDAMKPLGLAMFQAIAGRNMYEAGSRLFVDITQQLGSPTGRAGLLGLIGKSDPLIRDAVQTMIDREFVEQLPDDPTPSRFAPPPGAPEPDPAMVTTLIERSRAALGTLEREIETRTGIELLDFIVADIQETRRLLSEPASFQLIMAGMQATWWLNDHLQEWLGEKGAADTFAQSVPNNVTSEMGLALLDVADVVRRHPEVVTFLEAGVDDSFLDALPAPEVRDAIVEFLARYGMRGVGEIDITRPRWRERPTTLVPLILGNVKNFTPGAGARRFEQGRREAEQKEREVLERLRASPDGEQKATETKRMIDRVRAFAGYREYPKYGLVSRTAIYRRALLGEAKRLVAAGVLREADDIFYLSLEELREVVRTQRADDVLIGERRVAYRVHCSLAPPRMITSDGEIITGRYRRDDAPAGALLGLAVSAGTVEGRARVILDIADANLEAGDILVTAFTDPSWTPVFVGITALVTEVGGLMTHGAVIAREYGLPAVVGVERATQLIRDGQRIRVHGTDGYVEILD